MSKKLSQSEIDDLVSSLLQSEPVAETPAAPAPPAASAPQPSPEPVTFEQMQDLGPITQAELDQAEAEHRDRKAAQSAPATAPQVATPAPQVATPAPQVATAAPQTAPAAAAQAAPAPKPAAAPAAAAMAMPPSSAQYAASQAQSAAQARRTLSMASLYGVLMDIDLTVTVELGRAHLSLGEVLSLGPGSVITLEKLANSPVDVLVNRLPLMTAEVLAIGEKYGVRILESNMAAKEAS